MPEKNGNGIGKWQLAFWIITVVCFGGIGLNASLGRANDTKQTKDNVRIEDKFENKFDTMTDKIHVAQTSANHVLMRIETALVGMQKDIEYVKNGHGDC